TPHPTLSLRGLPDSHIILGALPMSCEQGCATFHGLELEPSLEHDDGSWLAVVAGPAAQASADPGGVGERALGMGVFLALGLALQLVAAGFEQGLVVRVEGIAQGPQRSRSALAGMDELLDDERGDQGRG